MSKYYPIFVYPFIFNVTNYEPASSLNMFTSTWIQRCCDFCHFANIQHFKLYLTFLNLVAPQLPWPHVIEQCSSKTYLKQYTIWLGYFFSHTVFEHCLWVNECFFVLGLWFFQYRAYASHRPFHQTHAPGPRLTYDQCLFISLARASNIQYNDLFYI